MVEIKKALNELKEGSKLFGERISAVINLFLLSFVYFIGFGFTSIFAKIFRKSFTEKKISKNSYWEELNLNNIPLENYYKQF